MLKKENRLSLRSSRTKIEESRQSARTPFFTLLYLSDGDSLSPRFAFLISKKTLRLSVDRHSLKRQLSQIIRDDLAKVNPKLQVIIIPSFKSLSLNPVELKEALLYAISLCTL